MQASINARIDRDKRVLILTANNPARSELAEYRRKGYIEAMNYVGEMLHEAYSFVDAGDVPGALTSAPILIDYDDLDWPDNGEVIIRPSADLFWFPNYMVIDEWAQLAQRGRVEFDMIPGNVPDAVAHVPEDLTAYGEDGEYEGHAFYVGEGVVKRMAPQLFDEGEVNEDRCEATPGLYFWGGARFVGPYPPTFPGTDHLREAGGYLPPAPFGTDPQLVLNL